jgi:hypothetical protein
MEITKHKFFYSCRHLKCGENAQEWMFTIRLTTANILKLPASAGFFLGLVAVVVAVAVVAAAAAGVALEVVVIIVTRKTI